MIWAAGVQASFLGKVLAQATGAILDRSGKVVVEPKLTSPVTRKYSSSGISPTMRIKPENPFPASHPSPFNKANM